MHRLSPLLLLALAVVFASACQPVNSSDYDAFEAAQPTTPVEGVWDDVEVSFTSADTSWTNEITDSIVLIFTKGHYASLRIAGPDEDRKLLQGECSYRRISRGRCSDVTDEQFLAALRGVRMNGGTYEVSGSSMTSTVIVHHNPNAMAEGRTNTITFEVDGDVMTRTSTNEENGNQWVVTYERRESPSGEKKGL